MKKRIAVIGLMVCIMCSVSCAEAAAAGKSMNKYALIKYVLKRAHIDFDVVAFERADGIYKGMIISVPDHAPLIVAVNETAAAKNTVLFSVNGEDTLATVSKNGTLILKSQQEGDPAGFLCIFQAILDLIQALQGCDKADTICVFENLIAFVTDVLGCSSTP